MGISECTEYLKTHLHIEQLINGAPALVGTVGTFGHRRKPDDAFRDKLKEIKKANPKSTIDTY